MVAHCYPIHQMNIEILDNLISPYLPSNNAWPCLTIILQLIITTCMFSCGYFLGWLGRSLTPFYQTVKNRLFYSKKRPECVFLSRSYVQQWPAAFGKLPDLCCGGKKLWCTYWSWPYFQQILSTLNMRAIDTFQSESRIHSKKIWHPCILVPRKHDKLI